MKFGSVAILLPALLLSQAEAKPGASIRSGRTAHLGLSIASYSAGTCIHVDVKGIEGARMLDSCRGWSVEGCTSLVMLRTEGIERDSAYILALAGTSGRQGHAVEAGALVEDEFKSAFGAKVELLRFKPGHVRCSDAGMTIPFAASFIRGHLGSATSQSGQIDVAENGRLGVRLGRVGR